MLRPGTTARPDVPASRVMDNLAAAVFFEPGLVLLELPTHHCQCLIRPTIWSDGLTLTFPTEEGQ